MEYETYERNGLIVRIRTDDSPESPRSWDNLGTMICSHRRYTLGDEQFNPDDYEGWDDIKKHLIEDEGAVLVLPLYLYDHSGITMYTSNDTAYHQHEMWDSGQVGFIYVDKKDLEQCYNEDEVKSGEALKLAEQCLRGEVKTYDQYLSGDVYGFSVTNPKDSEEVDSCWGFYGLDAVKEEANSIADAFVWPHDAAYAKPAGSFHG